MASSNKEVKGNVLIADDDRVMREILRHYLESSNYAVQTASDGALAWQMLDKAESAFDIVVTDYNMPHMNGMELLAKIKGDPRFYDLPVIFQTAIASREAIIEGVRAGIYHYLTKPYDEKTLLAFVDAAIEDNRRHTALKDKAADKKIALGLVYKAEFRFQSLNEARDLASLLSEMSCNPTRVVTGLSELLLNAVEHGNLGISYQEKTELVTQGRWRQEVDRRLREPEYKDRFVNVKVFKESATRTTFTIKDQGQGFDHAKYLKFVPELATQIHGRGIAMSRMLSFDSLEYVGNGNQVIAIIDG